MSHDTADAVAQRLHKKLHIRLIRRTLMGSYVGNGVTCRRIGADDLGAIAPVEFEMPVRE